MTNEQKISQTDISEVTGEKNIDNSSYDSGQPMLAEVEVTSICNANCVFCPRQAIPSEHHMTSNTWSVVLNRLKESSLRSVKFAGFGEPMLHPELSGMLSDLHQNKVRVSINTNLSTLHKIGANKILSLCDEVIASVHTLNPEIHRKLVGRNWFCQVKENLDSLLEANLSFGRQITIYVVVTRLNSNAPKEFTGYGKQVTVRVSGCSNRVVQTFPNYIIDLDCNVLYNSFASIKETDAVCGYASASHVIDCDGHYLLCTNDIARRTGQESVWTQSIEESAAMFRTGMKSGQFTNFCGFCENSDNYRSQYFKKYHRTQKNVKR